MSDNPFKFDRSMLEAMDEHGLVAIESSGDNMVKCWDQANRKVVYVGRKVRKSK